MVVVGGGGGSGGGGLVLRPMTCACVGTYSSVAVRTKAIYGAKDSRALCLYTYSKSTMKGVIFYVWAFFFVCDGCSPREQGVLAAMLDKIIDGSGSS